MKCCATTRQYKDLVFHVEWKFTKLPDEKAKYNSGVFIRNDADGTIWHQGQTSPDGGYLFGDTPVNGVVQALQSAAADGREPRQAGRRMEHLRHDRPRAAPSPFR